MQSITNSTAAAAASQKDKSLLLRLDANIGNIVENYGFIVNAAWVNDPPVRNSQEVFVMKIRAFRMVHEDESLLKLVLELKKIARFSGFASLNDHMDQRTGEFTKPTEKI
ncbi:Mediator of RNA polymerase II transcription subunit 22b [Capsicum annuum]|uniref:Mediator of RNA polymerase II transcription subunit 22b n=1 Tax=Capsicum annuum TaxID=4072 RepID=A0A2G2YZP3_CAPAN|nr:Mediator of RNA polymerase II transcription subunit 22b [Capsicum annuum]PHT75111.1 Mediator of RNA polymerase II transcription subunit 22b [Capsicum annuum]PHT75233.1 Mediator of RNA polymerase II transcription subunit 22b [Capsicum annuum]